MSGTKLATMSDVLAAYRIVLEREIDAGAEEAWQRRLGEHEVSITSLRDELLASAEYKALTAWTAVDVGGVSVIVDVNEPEFGRFIAHHGAWEAHVADEIRSRLSEGDVFVDIGANVGVMSFHAARAVGTAGRVIAFEPNPDNVQAFLKGVLFNGFSNVTLFPFGASNRPSMFALQGGSNTFMTDPSQDATIAQCFDADRVLANEARVDLIKIDIEGHEALAIEGLRRTIRCHHPIILCEFNPRCLRDHTGKEPEAFAATLHRLASGPIEVLHHDGEAKQRFVSANAAELMRLWTELDAEASQSGRLPAGMLHFDLIVST